MKSEIIKNRYFIECGCRDYEHIFVFDFDKEWEYMTVGFYFGETGFWYRLKLAFRYLFKKKGFYEADIIINSEHIEQLENLITDIKKERTLNGE